MKPMWIAGLAGLLVAVAGAPALAKPNGVPIAQASPIPASTPIPRRTTGNSNDPDVFLDVPNLSVQQIDLQVDKLQAHVNLNAQLANLLQLTAGVDANIDKVKLTIKGVKAQLQLRVRLDNVAAIIDRTLTTLDRNPQIVDHLLSTVDNTVNTVGGIAQTALAPNGLLSQTVNSLGQTVGRVVDVASGNILEKTLNAAGQVVGSRVVGSLTSLPKVGGATTNAQGQTIQKVRDSSGKIIDLVLDTAGKVTGATIEGAAGPVGTQ